MNISTMRVTWVALLFLTGIVLQLAPRSNIYAKVFPQADHVGDDIYGTHNRILDQLDTKVADNKADLVAIQDASVNSAKPDFCHGLQISLITYRDGGEVYVKFDLTGIAPERIGRAALRLYCQYTEPDEPRDVNVHQTSESWNETTITWNNKPAMGEFLATASVDGHPDDWFEWTSSELLNYVKSKAGGTVSFVLQLDPGGPPGFKLFSARTGGEAPILEVNLYCGVSLEGIDFGPVTLGQSRDTTFTITNTSEATLTGNVSESSDHYEIFPSGGHYSLEPGESCTVTVRYKPVSAGEHACTIETGNAYCSDVSCTGIGSFYFIHITDTHIEGLLSRTRFAYVISQINNLDPQPEFVVISGDLVDTGSDVGAWAPCFSCLKR